MILLDTHIWIWWVNESQQLTVEAREIIRVNQPEGLAVSIISCWEVAKLVERGRLDLTIPVEEWLENALLYPAVRLLDLTPRIVVESTQLPGSFHRDPADQLIVATARVYDLPLLTSDEAIVGYPYVRTADLADDDPI